MNEGIYYLRLNGKVEGPYSIGQIYDLWAARKINSQTPFARFEEMDKWQPLAELTLKISAPKSQAPKAPPEPSPTGSGRSRPSANFMAEERAALAYRREARPRSKPMFSGLASRFSKGAVFNFSVLSGICITLGGLITGYFLIVLPSSAEAKEAAQSLLMLKQTGVIAGMGLVLMGGLLIIARQITQVVVALKTEVPKMSNQDSED
jgi:hypothetical protein